MLALEARVSTQPSTHVLPIELCSVVTLTPNTTCPINFWHPVMDQETTAAAAAAAEAEAARRPAVAMAAIITRQTHKFTQRLNEPYVK